MASEIIHHLKKKRHRKEGMLALEIDMEKAYDRHKWPFFKGIMPHMGLSNEWVQHIMTFV